MKYKLLKALKKRFTIVDYEIYHGGLIIVEVIDHLTKAEMRFSNGNNLNNKSWALLVLPSILTPEKLKDLVVQNNYNRVVRKRQKELLKKTPELMKFDKDPRSSKFSYFIFKIKMKILFYLMEK